MGLGVPTAGLALALDRETGKTRTEFMTMVPCVPGQAAFPKTIHKNPGKKGL